uniref:Zgc:113276 n=1 Tax=Sphaeramia orbicularis TaxID=375764 RepID=A0A673APV6_9TELE
MVLLDVLIIGGGPHALTLATLLSNPNPDTNSHSTSESDLSLPLSIIPEGVYCPPPSLRVVDSYGEWAVLWESQFTALNIPHLRSHVLVHTDPFNKTSLQDFVVKTSRSAELHSLPEQVYILDENAFFNDMRLGKKEKKRLNVTSTLKKSIPFSLPGTKLSVDFFKHQVERYSLDKVLVKGTVERIIPVTEENEENEEEIQLQEGNMIKARRVVMATGPTRAQMANIPLWVSSIGESYPEGRLQHTVHLMHHLPRHDCRLNKPTVLKRVMVVGGGLTSAHVVSIALQQGASHVTWVMRKHLQLKQFDVGDVESLVGRYSHVEHGIKMDGQAYLRQFYNERSLHKRLVMIHQARKGGAVTPEAYIHLQPFILNGQVDVKTYCQVSEASWSYRNQEWSVSLSSGDRWTGDMIWLATGCKLDVKQDPLLSEVMREFPIQVIDGWPCISESLQWAEGCPLYLMGQYTALQVIGPHAVNLAGGQAASKRIAKDITHKQQQEKAQTSGLNGETCEKSTTQEYIQQMHGLLWL